MVARNAVEARVHMENLNLRPSCWCPSRHVGPCATQAVSGFPSCSCCLYQPAPTHINHSSPFIRNQDQLRVQDAANLFEAHCWLDGNIHWVAHCCSPPILFLHRWCCERLTSCWSWNLSAADLLIAQWLVRIKETAVKNHFGLVGKMLTSPPFQQNVGSAQKPNLNAPVDRTIHEGVKISCCLK